MSAFRYAASGSSKVEFVRRGGVWTARLRHDHKALKLTIEWAAITLVCCLMLTLGAFTGYCWGKAAFDAQSRLFAKTALGAVATGWYGRNAALTGNPVYPMEVRLGSTKLCDGAYGRAQMENSSFNLRRREGWIGLRTAAGRAMLGRDPETRAGDPRIRAAWLWFPSASANVRSRIWRSMSRNVDAFGAGCAAPAAGCGVSSSSAASGRSATFTSPPRHTSAARSITLLSSRTLPSQGCPWSAARASREMTAGSRPSRRDAWRRKRVASGTMSSLRSRSGGSRTGNTFNR